MITDNTCITLKQLNLKKWFQIQSQHDANDLLRITFFLVRNEYIISFLIIRCFVYSPRLKM